MVSQAPDGTMEFHLYRPQVSQMFLAGDFNAWCEPGWPLTRSPDGWWRCRLQLAPGVYEFRYLADGAWLNDYAAFGLAYGPHGMNSVLKVDAPRTRSNRPDADRSIPLSLPPTAESTAA